MNNLSKEIIFSLLKTKLSNSPVIILIIFWLILCASFSFIFGGETQKTVENLYTVKYQEVNGIDEVLFNTNAQTYQICYDNNEITDVLKISDVNLTPERKYGPNKGVLLFDQSKKVLGCIYQHSVKVNSCPSAWRRAEHCYLVDQFNKLKLFHKSRVPQLVEYHSQGREELNFDKLLYLPVAVILDAVIVPFNALMFFTIAYALRKGV